MPENATLVFILFAAIVVFSTIATKIRISYTIMLTIGGLLLSFIPGLPKVELDPDLVLFLFLPPLIFASAWQTSWREFLTHKQPILWLVVGLVLATTVFVAVVAHLFLALPWPVAFVLGAILSPTDAVAASATARSMKLPRYIETTLEGESMLNDSTGLVVYKFAVAALVAGSFSFWSASLDFVLVALGGVVLGLLISLPILILHYYLEDPAIEITVTLLTPYAAYLLAEALHVSGILASLAAGLFLSWRSARFFSSKSRLQANAVWDIFVFLLNGVLFLLIGLQLRSILEVLGGQPEVRIIRDAAIISASVIVIRLAWVFLVIYLPQLIRSHWQQHIERPDWKSTFLIGWTGLRGGVSLAAALALPLTLQNNQPFVQRDLILFLTFGVILVTLVGQGLTLKPLIKLLKLSTHDATLEQEHIQARKAAIHAAIKRLQILKNEDWVPQEHYKNLYEYYQNKLHNIRALADEERREEMHEHLDTRRRLRHEVLKAERDTVIRLRDQHEIDDEVLRALEHEFDLEEQRLSGSTA